MRRIPVLLVVAAVVPFGLFALGRATAGTTAQDDAAATAAHPAVGAWLLIDPAFADAPDTLAVFHADGTYVLAEAGGGPVGVGAWQATGERSLAVTYVLLVAGDAGALFPLTVRASGEVDGGGNALSATYTYELAGPDGVGQGEFGPSTVTGERIAVEPMGTPVGAIEEVYARFDPSGAPAAATPNP